MSLQVVVKSASNLPAADRAGTSDPYVKLTYAGKTEKTKKKEKDVNPTWEENFEFPVKAPVPGDAKLLVRIYDWNKIMSDKLIGQVDISLKDIKRQGYKVDTQYSLIDGHGQPCSAKVALSIVYNDPEGGGDSGGGDGGGGEAEGEADAEADDAGIDDEGGGGDGASPARRKAKASKSAKQAAEKRQKRDAMLQKFPDKPLDFQVRVHIIEGRKLLSSVQPIDPITNVCIGNETRHTKVLQDTDKPFWDEMFFFELKMKPSEVFDLVAKQEVCHSRTLRKDALIGSFQFDLGMVYLEDGHALIHKWLLLTDPDDAASGPKGYLKVSVMVLGPGDEPIRLPKVVMDDKCDIESNLLRPAGVQLQPATLTMKVFKCEEVPRMDVGFFQGLKSLFSKNKEQVDLVDPYVEVFFAGKKVKTKVIDENANPEFYQKLNLGVKMPSMCDRIRVRIIDRDKGFGAINQDDVVGTTYIPVSQISAPGEDGFLPLFGPCFVNLYGAPRAFDITDEYDYLNEGEMEGAAYRGRALVEVATTLGTYPKEAVSDMSGDEINRIVPYMRRRKFTLNVAFFDATMVAKKDGLISFEVSIGNYGNNFEGSGMPMPSMTQGSTPSYNGDFYYYISWSDNKPCCTVTCQWEDVSYRLRSLTILENTCERLMTSIKNAEELIEFEATPKQCASAVIQLLNQLLDDLSDENTIGEPNVKDPNTTKLDLKMYEIRYHIVSSLRGDVKNLRDNATNLQEALDKCREFHARLKSVTYEAQNSFPDIVIWMLSSNKRIAYKRIPANQVMFAKKPLAKGKFCSQMTTVYLKYHGKKGDDEDHQEIPAAVRVMMWLGSANHQREFLSSQKTGTLAVFAETYENKSSLPIVGWSSAVGRPDWSDALGKMRLNKDFFNPPEGWKWESEWNVVAPNSATAEEDSNVTVFQEDVFEYEVRVPGTNWANAQKTFGDVRGNVNKEVTELAQVTCPEGWQWIDLDWEVDVNRAVDEEGFEYTVDDSVSEYSPAERMYHMCRRRRWIRTRQRTAPVKETKPKQQDLNPDEQWEFCKVFRTEAKYHTKERTFDLAKRRRWLRKMVAAGASDPPYFQLPHPDKKNDFVIEAPRTFLTFSSSLTYELRVYLYQARSIRSGDDSGMSDAYCRVSFQRRSQKSIMIPENVMPTWDQTMIFENVQLYEDPRLILANPPDVVVEIYDKDTIAKDDFLGRVIAPVFVHAAAGVQPFLKWFPIYYAGQQHGQILAAFHLIATSDNPVIKKQQLPKPPQDNKGKYIVPSGIRPEMQKMRIEILAWGVREMKRYQLLSVDNPSVQIECGGVLQSTDQIKSVKRNPNFSSPLLLFEAIYLPKKRVYCPPVNIRVLDHRAFGRKPLVGLHCIETLDKYRVSDQILAEFRPAPKPPKEETDRKDAPDGAPDPAATAAGAAPGAAAGAAVAAAASTPSGTVTVTATATAKLPTPVAKGKGVEVAVTVDKVEGDKKDAKAKKEETQEKYDWWSKFYASVSGPEAGGLKAGDYPKYYPDQLEVYPGPLEKVEGFDGLADFLDTFQLHRGKGTRDDDGGSKEVGTFKGSIKMYPLPEDGSEEPPRIFASAPSSTPVPVVVRVYVVQAFDLTPKDDSGKNDAYLIVQLGKTKVDNRDNYIPNELNPVFGCFFELEGVLPITHQLKIQVKDYDLISADDLIGETVIDLENRYLSKHRALAGLPDEYYLDGINKWRDAQDPSEILAQTLNRFGFPEADFSQTGEVRVGSKRFNMEGLIEDEEEGDIAVVPESTAAKQPLVPAEQEKKPSRIKSIAAKAKKSLSKSGRQDEKDRLEKEKKERARIAGYLGPEKERLALRALHGLQSVRPGHELVPEHVETRPLYNPMRPNVEQGRLQMWVDLFVDPAKNGAPPPPVDISCRKPNDYVLRIVVWNVKDVILDETNLLGEAMSDIYVSSWMRGIDEKQKTDVHYRSLNGEGNFNWRMVFPFNYYPAEQCMSVTKKEHFWSLDKTERRLPPVVTFQVWDNDLFNPDDFLGDIDINLNSVVGSTKSAKKCTLNQLPEFHPKGIPSEGTFNLFERKRVRGWWPVKGKLTSPPEKKGEVGLTGKIELELEIVTKEEAELRPAAPARDDPNMNPKLDPPNRPDTSFFWFTSPWKSCKYIIWRRLKWLILTLLIISIFAALIVLFFYSFPGYVSRLIVIGN